MFNSCSIIWISERGRKNDIKDEWVAAAASSSFQLIDSKTWISISFFILFKCEIREDENQLEFDIFLATTTLCVSV